MQAAVVVFDGEIPYMGFVIGYGYVQSVRFIVDFVNKVGEHGGGKQERHWKIRPVGNDYHVGIDEAAKLKDRNLIKRAFRHAAKAAKFNFVFYLGCTSTAKSFLAVHPYGIDCACINHGIQGMKLIQLDYRALICRI